jgi:hypothetical protein
LVMAVTTLSALEDEGFGRRRFFSFSVLQQNMVIYMYAAFIRVARNMGIDDWVLAVLSAVCGRALELAVERFDLACGGRAVPCKARKASGWIWCSASAGLLGLRACLV